MLVLPLQREDTIGVFHALAVASLLTIAVGLSPMLLGKQSPPVIATHACCMAWSYAGLVAAGCGQLAATAEPTDGAWVVPVVSGRCCPSAPSSSSGESRQPSMTCSLNSDPAVRNVANINTTRCSAEQTDR